MPTVEVILGNVIRENRLWLAKLVNKYRLGIGSIHTVHRIICHGEVITIKQCLDGVEVKDGLQQIHMILGRRNDLNDNRAASIVRFNGGRSSLSDINLREVCADLVALDRRSVSICCLHEVFGSGATVLCVVLDAKILLWASRVVAGSEDESAKRLLPHRTTFTDGGRDGRGREQSILANPETLHAIGDTHPDDRLDGLIVVVTPVSSDQKSALRHIGTSRNNSIKYRLDEVVEVVLRHELLGLLTEARSSWLLTADGSRLNLRWFQSTRHHCIY
mmetsp:Transcript_5870/g.14695  ORF Transcript_5870/g.14695 Transcript_5870/m.14695 type:complete len:275 (-) Transcript_5870:159-983(-)